MSVVISVVCALMLTLASAECLRILQAVGYRPNRGYIKICVSWYYLSLIAVQVAAVFLVGQPQYFVALLYAALALCWMIVKRKVPLKLTKRVARTFLVQFAVLVALCVGVSNCYWVWLLPFVTLVSWAICLPADCLINRYYIGIARRKLALSNAQVIAITGSYGKTSVKDMLKALLDDSVAPSGSCNTPLGIAKFINGTDISHVRYIILEFGARQSGDIKQLCKLYSPAYGIVTGVCAQHLSTFGSLNNVIAAKRELPENLPERGWCVVNFNDDIAMQHMQVGKCAVYPSDKDVKVSVLDTSLEGTTLYLCVNGGNYTVKLPQIAAYVCDTLAMCVQATLLLGQDIRRTVSNAEFVKQTPHRMQIYRAGDIYIVDDGYNASIQGVKSCCQTLQQFTCCKTVIAQGIAECGNMRRQLNITCGKLLGQTCDTAVVLGRNAKFIAEGLLQTNCKILHARTLKQAVSIARQHTYSGILLFQNDLPD